MTSVWCEQGSRYGSGEVYTQNKLVIVVILDILVRHDERSAAREQRDRHGGGEA